MRKVLFSLVLFSSSVQFASAQHMGVRIIMGEVHSVYKRPVLSNYCMGLGVDRSFNDRLTIGLDFSYDLVGALSSGLEDQTYFNDGNVSAYYDFHPHLLNVNYHTEYALSDNDGGHFYVGTFIGLRHITQDWANDGYSSDYDYVSIHSENQVSQWLVPMGLRFGVRGSTEGGFVDLYSALGYQVGGGKTLFKPIGSGRSAKYTETTSFAWTMGLAYGIGW